MAEAKYDEIQAIEEATVQPEWSLLMKVIKDLACTYLALHAAIYLE